MRLESLLHVQQLAIDLIVLLIFAERDRGLMILLLQLLGHYCIMDHNMELIGSSLGHLLLHL